MRLFKRHRSCAKSEPSTTADDSQKTWGIHRLFQTSSGSALSKEPAASAAAAAAAAAAGAADGAAAAATEAAIRLDGAAKKRQPMVAASDFSDDCSPVNYRFANQNYTPEVALSPDTLPLTPAVLPLRQLTDSHNSGDVSANTEDKAKEIERYEQWQRRKPHFHFGPRQQSDGEGDGGDLERRGSASASSATNEADNLITLPPKYAFIYQDGKFVEREVTRWPNPLRALPHLRYRILEPYASHYGKRYRKRLGSDERIVSQKQRLIYQNPIYRLPRKIMEENKSRLMTRHSLKDRLEGTNAIGGPQKLEVGEREQSKAIKKMAEKYNHKQAEKLVDYITVKGKAGKAQ